MIPQQRIAIENPCELAQQCSHPRYISALRIGRYTVSRVLTVNVGEE